MPNFVSNSTGINIEEYASTLLTEPELIDRYIGNQLWIWGSNGGGELGDNTIISKSSPIQTISRGTNWKEVTATGYGISAIKTDGTIWSWGQNIFGILGDGTNTNRSSPVQIAIGGTNWQKISATTSQAAVAAIKTDGTLWIWGLNNRGQLGDNTTVIARSSPVQTVSGGRNWLNVYGMNGGSGFCAIKTDGTLWVWGEGTNGQLGDNVSPSVHRSSPVQTVAGGTNWKSAAGGNSHRAAIKTDGTLWVWGIGTSGQLGDNTIISKSSPIQTIAGGNNWKQASFGQVSSSAIKTDGTLWVWGSNSPSGRLGTGNIVSYSSPVQTISGGTNWKQVFMSGGGGGLMTGAIKTDGTLWMWGQGTSGGGLGDGSIIGRSSPVQTLAGGNNWKFVVVDDGRAAALTYSES